MTVIPENNDVAREHPSDPEPDRTQPTCTDTGTEPYMCWTCNAEPARDGSMWCGQCFDTPTGETATPPANQLDLFEGAS